jgi:hypothetical protein
MSDADVARYRREAEECRSFAAKMVNPIDKDRLLRIADEWLKLAQARPQPDAPNNLQSQRLA